MRRFLTPFAFVGLASVAAAQTMPVEFLDCQGFDDGGSEKVWKVGNPSGPGDWFTVDFDATSASSTVVGLCLATFEGGPGGIIDRLGLYGDDLIVDPSGATPDISGASTIVESTNNPLPGSICEFAAYIVPKTTLGTTTVHMGYHLQAGDSVTWLCSDTSSAPANRSYFTATNFASPAALFGGNWLMRIGAVPSHGEGELQINGGVTATVNQLDLICFSFFGCASPPPTPPQRFALFLAPPLPTQKVGPILPMGLMVGGPGGPGGPCPDASILCGAAPCNAPVGFQFPFWALYTDPCDLKASGKPKFKFSNTVDVGFNSNPTGCGFCYGQLDDSALDGYIFRPGAPRLTTDYFNVNHGVPSPASGVNTLTGVEVASWDFCGTGPSWTSVGIYDSNTLQDPSGGTPDLLSGSLDPTPAVPPAAAEWGYPATFYDTPDVAIGTADHHGAVQWPAGDSCILIGGDLDGTDNPCGGIPNTSSFLSGNAYATNATPVTSVSWQIKLDWK